MFVDLVAGTRPQVNEMFQQERQPLRLKNGVAVGDLKMQMRRGSLAGVAEPGQNGAAVDLIVWMDLDASLL